jgi:hypothetical protein
VLLQIFILSFSSTLLLELCDVLRDLAEEFKDGDRE